MILDQEQAMTTPPFYSHLLSCLHDQPGPVGRLGRGVHHSVFRSTQWRAIDGDVLSAPRVHDFAVIWDEDHDVRVIGVAERLHLAGLLWPVCFIGERKGSVTLLLDYMAGPEVFADEGVWIDRIREVASSAGGDEWRVEIGMFQHLVDADEGTPQTDPAGIIPEPRERVLPYLQAIDALWQVGDREEPGGFDRP